MKSTYNFAQLKRSTIKGFKLHAISVLAISICMVLLPLHDCFAQEKTDSELFQTLKKLDAILFVNGFNKCQHADMEPYISDDLEFYHDQGGLSIGKAIFFKTIKQNICSNWDMKPIRKLIDGSLEVFPLYTDGKIYGAIQKGIHEFYIKEPNKEMYLTSTAKFTHVWLVNDNQWQIKRVLSYDHQTPKPKSTSKIVIIDTVLKAYAGQYEAPNTGVVMITIKADRLIMNAGEMSLELLPETETLFFNKQMPLTFQFVSNAEGKITKMVIREHGKVVEEAKKM